MSTHSTPCSQVLVKERSIWELGQIEVLDGGPDGDADTADNAVFARQAFSFPRFHSQAPVRILAERLVLLTLAGFVDGRSSRLGGPARRTFVPRRSSTRLHGRACARCARAAWLRRHFAAWPHLPAWLRRPGP